MSSSSVDLKRGVVIPVLPSGLRRIGFGLGAAGLTYVVGRLIVAGVTP